MGILVFYLAYKGLTTPQIIHSQDLILPFSIKEDKLLKKPKTADAKPLMVAESYIEPSLFYVEGNFKLKSNAMSPVIESLVVNE